MIKIPVQLQPGYQTLSVVSQEAVEELKAYKPYQLLNATLTGHRRARSVDQNAWIHCIFKLISDNAKDPDWDTPDKVKRNVKMAMKFFKDDVIVHGNKVYFELRSFAFDQMPQNEADIRYNEAKLVCANYLKVDPTVLEAKAKKETKRKGE